MFFSLDHDLDPETTKKNFVEDPVELDFALWHIVLDALQDKANDCDHQGNKQQAQLTRAISGNIQLQLQGYANARERRTTKG